MEKDTSTRHPDWIPLTKVIPPQVGDDILPRLQLVEQLLRAVRNRRLTLISAPAGSGKTVTAASLGQASTELTLAWLALDEEDDDPVTFLWLLAAALNRRFPGCGTKAMALLAELPNPVVEMERVVGVLINEVLAIGASPFALVIDDYHLIENPAIHDAMSYLLERLPPPWRLVIATRQDPPLPLARLRAQSRLAEFYLADLRFQKDDVQALFRERLALPLPAEAIAMLQARTEGWIAGLRLLASTLQAIDDAERRRRFLEQFAAADRHVFELLAEEVLNRQAADLQGFLLETSILRELTPRLCRSVTGREDAARLLAKAVRHNLFLSAIGEFETVVSPIYRYHHLFAEFLRHRLAQEQPDRIKELHRRAAEAETTPVRVVRHYLEAEAWEEAAEVIEQLGPQMLEEGQVARLQGWLKALPDSFRRQRPWLNYLAGMCSAESADFVKAAPTLETALQQFRDEGDERGETAALVASAYVAIGRHDFATAADLIDRVLERELSAYERVRGHINRAWLMLYQNEWPQVDADTAQAMEIALSSEDQGAISVLAQQLTTPLILGERGIRPIERYHQTILDGLGEEVSVVRAGTVAILSNLKWLQGELQEAVDMAREARAISGQFGGLTWMDIGWDIVLLADALNRADYASFERRWQARVPVYEETGARQWLIVYLYLQGRALWMQGRHDDLYALAGRAQATEVAFEPPESVIARQMIDALLLIVEGEYRQAETILLQAVGSQQRARHLRIFCDVRFPLAYLYREWDRPEDALAVLRPLLTTLAQRGTPGFVLQEGRYVLPLLHLALERDVQLAFVQEVLNLFDLNQETRPVPIPGSDEALTPREVEVLALLMTGATNKEIAGELVFTPRTARAHVSNILRKLDVSTRTEAVARAHQLNLLTRR